MIFSDWINKRLSLIEYSLTNEYIQTLLQYNIVYTIFLMMFYVVLGLSLGPLMDLVIQIDPRYNVCTACCSIRKLVISEVKGFFFI